MNKRIRLHRLLLLAAIFLMGSLVSLRAQCPGSLASWLYRVPIDISNPGGGLSSYYMLIRVNTSTPIAQAKMKADGGDIRITDANCNLLNFWIQDGLGTATTNIWVSVASLPAGNSRIYMYYGNSSAVISNQASNVFGANLAALYTFTEGAGTTLNDWVGPHDMNITGSITWGAGFRNNVSGLSGFSGGRVNVGGVGPSLSTGSFTTIAYIQPTAANGSTQGIIGNYNGDGANGWVLKLQGGAGQMMLLTNQAGNWCQSSSGTLVNGNWHMVGARRNAGATNSLFQNGNLIANICGSDNRNLDGPGPFELGRSYNGSYAFSGSISFAAVYNAALTDQEVSSIYSSLYANPEPVPTIGTEETVEPPVITLHPQPQTVCLGEPVTFTVAATGPALTYQWRKDSIPIPGANGTTYSIPAADGNHSGVYDVVVRNQVTTNPARLIVNQPAGIISDPVGRVLCPGTPITFSVQASGAGLTYQWRRNGVPIDGAINPQLSIPATQEDLGAYDVVVTGICGEPATSAAAEFVLYEVPTITSQPSDQVVCRGEFATFSVTATGTDISYQWRKNEEPIEGATEPTLTIYAEPFKQGVYDVVVNGLCQPTAISNRAQLTVALDPIITDQPIDRTAQLGQTVVFRVRAMGGGTLTYQWQKDGVLLPGRISDTLIINNVSLDDIGDYSAIIRGTQCALAPTVSNKASLMIDAPPAIVKNPEDAFACVGGSAIFSVTAAGSSLTYQWRKNGTNIPGATTRDFSLTNVTSADAGTYDVVVKGAANQTLNSSTATLTVQAPASIGTQPSDVTVCPGMPATFTIGASGDGLLYQWRKNGDDVNGATSATLSIPTATAADTGTYSVMIMGACTDSLLSQTVRLQLNDPVMITQEPTSASIAPGGSATFTVAATGTGVSYQWRKDGVNIPGATGSSYSITAARTEDAGKYDVVVSGACAPADTSAQATLNVGIGSVPDDAAIAGSMLKVIPQPAYGQTRLEIVLPQGVRAGAGAELVLFDMHGKAVLNLSESFARGGYRGAEFDASMLSSGVYYCRLTTKSWNGTLGTIVIEK